MGAKPRPVTVLCDCGWRGSRSSATWDRRPCPKCQASLVCPQLGVNDPPSKKAAKKKAAARRRAHEGVAPATDRELYDLRGHPQDLPPGRQGKPVTLKLTAEQTPDLAVVYAHYRHRFPKATHGDLVAWLLREYRRGEGLA